MELWDTRETLVGRDSSGLFRRTYLVKGTLVGGPRQGGGLNLTLTTVYTSIGLVPGRSGGRRQGSVRRGKSPCTCTFPPRSGIWMYNSPYSPRGGSSSVSGTLSRQTTPSVSGIGPSRRSY